MYILYNIQTSGEFQPLPTCSGSVCDLFQLPLQESNHVETFNLGSFMWTSIPSKLTYPLKIDTRIRWNSILNTCLYKRVPNFKRHKFLHFPLKTYLFLPFVDTQINQPTNQPTQRRARAEVPRSSVLPPDRHRVRTNVQTASPRTRGWRRGSTPRVSVGWVGLGPGGSWGCPLPKHHRKGYRFLDFL